MQSKSLLAVSLAVFALIVVLAGVSTGQSSTSSPPPASPNAAPLSDEDARIRIGFQIAPVPLRLHGKDPSLVGLGSYLVNAVADCNGCHTSPPYADGHDPFQGQPAKINAAVYLAGGAPFGPFTSRNLTPDPATRLPANLTFGQFAAALRTGVDPDHQHPGISPLLQVMPWPAYARMSTHDLLAIYTYLSAIPHAENPNAQPGD